MNVISSLKEKTGKLLRTNKIAILLEIIVVIAPLYLGLVVSHRTGSNHIPLGGNVVMLGGPPAYLGMVLSLLLLWLLTRLKGAGWSSFGVSRPKNWFQTILMGLGVALGVFVVVILVINPMLNAMPNLEPRDMSQFDYLTGSVPNLIINVILMWITAGFLEEFMWRGYLMNRLIDLLGSQTKLTWLLVAVISAAIFGLAHGYQGTMGMLKTGAIGLVFGIAYLAVGRNLWPLILAHGLIDTSDFITHFFGG